MDFRVLGSLEVVENGEALRLGGLKQRALLAILLLRANQTVPADRLIDELWGEHPPETAANVLQVYISQLRKLLGGAGRLVRNGRGYELRIERDELDLHRFEDRVEEARQLLASDDVEAASALLREALALWRGPPLAEFAFEPFAAREIGRLEELRLAAIEDRIDADLERGRHAVLVGELEALVAEHPLRERLRGQLMLALYRAGRQAEALQAYQSARRTLDEELGLQPSQRLRDLERAILTQDPVLEVAEEGRVAVATRVETPVAATEEEAVAGARVRRRRSRPIALYSVAAVGVAAVAILAAFLLARPAGNASVEVLPNSAVRIDPETNRITASVPVGVEPVTVAIVHGVALVWNKGEDTISRIDTNDWRFLGTLAVGGRILGITTSTDWAWTLSQENGLISRIDPRENRVVERIQAPGSIGPETGFAYMDGGLWLSNGGSARKFDPTTRRVTQRIEIDAPTFGEVDGNTVYVLLPGRRIGAFDLRTGRRLRVMPQQLPGDVTGVDLNEREAWLSIGARDEVVRVDRRSERITARVAVGSSPYEIAIGKDGIVWVTNLGDGTVSKIDSKRAEVVATIELGRPVISIDVTPSGAPWVVVHE